ncbi:MAG TPA: ABC transporter permease [Chloroflexi bacterium]|nr:ABC transporter permease [Chloroflexota bacterium]
MSELLAMARKEFRHILRDPWLLTTITVGAVLLIMLMSYTLSTDVEQVPIAVVDSDRSAQSRAYLQSFGHDDFFDLAYWPRSAEEALEHLRLGEAHGAVIVPAGFANATLRGEKATVQIVVDGTEPSVAAQILGHVKALSAKHSIELLEKQLDRAGLSSRDDARAFEFRIRTLYNANLKEINSILPGLMALSLSMPTIAAALSLARERETGTLESLIATPMRRYQLLAGKMIPYLLVGLLDVLLFAGIGLFAFDVPFRGRLLDLIIFSGLFLFANLGISLLISGLVRTQMAALISAGFILTLPVINESGLFRPLYAMPPGARTQALLWPATHYVKIARGIFLKGVGARILLPNGLFLLAFGLVLNGLSVWRFKKKLS